MMKFKELLKRQEWAKICEHIIRHYNEGWADGNSHYCGLSNLRTYDLAVTAHVFAAFNRLFRAHNRLETVKGENAPDVLAAGNENMACVLLSNYAKDVQVVNIQLENPNIKQVYCFELTESNGFILKNEQISDGKYQVVCKRNQVHYMIFCEENTGELLPYIV